MDSNPILAIDQFTTKPEDFGRDLDTFAQAGVKAIEVCEEKLPEDFGRAREQLEALRALGFTVTSVQARVHALFPDRMAEQPRDPAVRMERFRWTIDLVARTFPDTPISFVLIGGAAPDGDYRYAWEMAQRMCPILADYAADHGFRIAFEPIHPVLMNLDTFICTLDDALRLIDRVNRDNFGLCFDVWHLWPERDLVHRIIDLGPRIFLVHLSDWPRGGPRRYDDRVSLGEGQIDLPTILGALDDAGYAGPYCLEILSSKELPDSLWTIDPVRLIRANIDAFHRLWHARVKPLTQSYK